MKPLSIGEVAKRAGIRTSALRYYEEAGVLPRPARINGRRCYDADVLRQIGVLQFAQQAGFTLREIKGLFHDFRAEPRFSARWRSLAQTKLNELDTLAERIAVMRRAIETGLRCGCVRLEDCSLSPKTLEADAKPKRNSGAKQSCC